MQGRDLLEVCDASGVWLISPRRLEGVVVGQSLVCWGLMGGGRCCVPALRTFRDVCVCVLSTQVYMHAHSRIAMTVA